MTIKEQYRKERRRIQQFLRRAEKRGYLFEEDILPPIPKAITKASVRRLAKLKPDFLYSHAHYVDPTTGEYMPAQRGRIEERKRSAYIRKIRNVAKKEREARKQQTKRQAPPTAPRQGISYYPAADYLSYQGLMVLLDSSASGHANARIMKWYIADYLARRGQTGLVELVRVFATPEGEEAIREASEIAYDSDGERARQWWTKFEKILVETGVITEEEQKELQYNREADQWQSEAATFIRRNQEE